MGEGPRLLSMRIGGPRRLAWPSFGIVGYISPSFRIILAEGQGNAPGTRPQSPNRRRGIGSRAANRARVAKLLQEFDMRSRTVLRDVAAPWRLAPMATGALAARDGAWGHGRRLRRHDHASDDGLRLRRQRRDRHGPLAHRTRLVTEILGGGRADYCSPPAMPTASTSILAARHASGRGTAPACRVAPWRTSWRRRRRWPTRATPGPKSRASAPHPRFRARRAARGPARCDIHDNTADGLSIHTSGVELDEFRSEERTPWRRADGSRQTRSRE